ncbi:hypothetical protein HAX54_041144 [Datura stramonium]|uniref:F-box associated beta-propeller type 3 domain-containing protein n=1 Tax=Datura stramonium TaxID=4076 RepID=A0ABS8VST8_DATST|nr:hypothetical protein [Datura stramonium]
MVLPEGMIIEILLRLPLTHLFRCNSNSLFQGSVSITTMVIIRIPLLRRRLLSNSWGECESAEIRFTQVINGLFCIYTPAGGRTLCNCYTSETRKIPLPKFLRQTNKIRFYLEFDPVGGNYKLLSLGCLSINYDLVIYQEILTLGGINNHQVIIGSWIKMRPTDFLPDIDVMCKPSICINGILYWLLECMDNKQKILAFNFLLGCFYDVSLPAQILVAADFDQLKDLSTTKIVNFMGSLAVGCLENVGADSVTSSRILNLWE